MISTKQTKHKAITFDKNYECSCAGVFMQIKNLKRHIIKNQEMATKK